MARRTLDQLIDQITFSIASTHAHYGPRHNGRGLCDLRNDVAKMCAERAPWCDACYLCDVYDDDPYADHHQRIVVPEGWDSPSFREFLEHQVEELAYQGKSLPEKFDVVEVRALLDGGHVEEKPEVERLLAELERLYSEKT